MLGKRHIVAAVLVSFALVVAIVTALVLSAIGRVADHANRLDDERSRETVAGALQALNSQLSATLNDYAAWDDAATYVYSPRGMKWVESNYGGMTINSDLFDTAILMDVQRNTLMFYRHGNPTTWKVQDYFEKSMLPLIDRVMNARAGTLPEAVGYVKTATGIAIAGVALVREKSGNLSVPADKRRFLIFARQIGYDKVETLAKTYLIDGLHLAPVSNESAYNVEIVDSLGESLGKLVWKPRAPGDVSFVEARPLVLAAISFAGIFFLTLFITGMKALGKLKADETEARRLSNEDTLSGLLNRAGMFIHLDRLVETARKDRCEVLFLYLDLDGFKEVNDSYGHGTGDRLIQAVAAELKKILPPGVLIGRVGGDEFAIAACMDNAQAGSAALCRSVMAIFDEPFIIAERVAPIGCSIGTAISPCGEIDGAELMRRADMAMYLAKETGRRRCVPYNPSMDTQREARNLMEVDLRAAIEKQELTVVYQPVVDALSGLMTGVEALVRWNRDGFGPISPEIFIPIAESTGLIDPVGLFVLRKACQDAASWPDISVSVNLSPGQLRNPGFVDHVRTVLAETGTDASRITLEVTEGYFIQNPDRARNAINGLRKLGIEIALDDFGAGFSSIGYLRQFRFDRMKIDRSLIDSLDTDTRAIELLQATISLARALEIPVTGEGVETERQASLLRLCGCTELQGYLFSRPVSADLITSMMLPPQTPQRHGRAG